MTTFSTRVRDFSDEYSSINIPVEDAITGPEATALRGAITGVVRGSILRTDVVRTELIDAGADVRPASSDAHREDKLVVQYTYLSNGVSKKGRYSLPAFDRALLSGGSEVLSPASPEYVALKAAFDASVLSPVGTAITVESAYYVSANL